MSNELSVVSSELRLKAHILEALRESGELASAIIINELFVGRLTRRADLVVASNDLVAFELKSEADSLTRLQAQTQTYLRYFDRVVVVVAGTHSKGAMRLAPRNAGLWCVEPDGSIKILRRGRARRPDRAVQLEFLPPARLRRLAKRAELPSGRSRRELRQLCSQLPEHAVGKEVLDFLRDTYRERTSAFWAAVGERQIEPQDLKYLSRYADQRRRFELSKESNESFWKNWQQDARRTLAAIAAS